MEFKNNYNVGDRVHVLYYTDVEPATVIKVTAKSVTVRMDDAELDKEWSPEIISGGFSGYCVNNHEQKWNIFENPNGNTETFRQHKDGRFYSVNKGSSLGHGWAKFYDYNF